MIYPQNFEQKTGFDKVRRLISEKCLSPLGEERVAEMGFSADYQTVTQRLEQTNEFVRILHGEDEFPASYFFDVRYSLKRIRPEGTWLDEKELFDLKRSLQTINDIIRFFRPSLEEGEEIKYPALTALAGDILVFPQLIGKIDAILDKFGRVKDNASPSLAQIRKEITATMSGISRSLQSILRAAQSEGVVDKDITPTMRDGRLMIPVAPAFKRKIKGIVHDESASGKTVFIEPEAVVEANNRIRELEGDERREIMKILTEFTNFVRPLRARHPAVLRVPGQDRLHPRQSAICRAGERNQAGPGGQTADRLDTRRTSPALPLVAETKQADRPAGYSPGREKASADNFRTERGR